MKFAFKSLSLFLILILLTQGCSKNSAKEESKTTDGGTKITDGSTNIHSSNFSNACEEFYYLANQSTKYHLNKNINVQKNIEIAFKNTVEYLHNAFNVDAGDIKTSFVNNSCDSFSQLAAKVKANEKINLYFSREKDPLDESVFVFSHVLIFYANSLDHFSGFIGKYTKYMYLGVGHSLSIGLRFLDRSEYHAKIGEDEKGNDKYARNPEYLYVEYTPTYLQEILPVGTKIYTIDNHVDDEPFDLKEKKRSFDDAMKYLVGWGSKGDVTEVTMKVKKIIDPVTKTYGEMEDVSFKYQSEQPKDVGWEKIQTKININGTEKDVNFGYITLTTFNKSDLIADYLYAVIKTFDKDETKLDGTIIDLRNNPGGTLGEAINVLSTILPKDAVLAHTLMQDTSKEPKPVKIQNPMPIHYGKIVLLTDYNSSSAAEVFAATLKDYAAVTIVGERTYGKAIGQYPFPTPKPLEGTLKITDSFIYSPTGKTWYLDGVHPDIEVNEPGNTDSYHRLDEDKKSLPPLDRESITAASIKDTKIPNQLTPEMLSKLQTFQKDPNEQPAECAKPGSSIWEEQSCIRSWGIKILEKWIEIDSASTI